MLDTLSAFSKCGLRLKNTPVGLNQYKKLNAENFKTKDLDGDSFHEYYESKVDKKPFKINSHKPLVEPPRL